MDPRLKVSPVSTKHMPQPGGTAFSTPVASRGVVKIGDETWPFICGSYYVLATKRSVMPAQGPGPRMASDVELAHIEVFLNAPVTKVTTCDGTGLWDIAKLAADYAEENQVTGLPITVGGEVFNLCELALPASFAHVAERVSIGRTGETLRVDGETFRFVLMKCVAESAGELGGPELLTLASAQGDA